MTRDELLKGITVLDGTAKLKVSKDAMEVELSSLSGELGPGIINSMPGLLKDAGIEHGALSVPEPQNGVWILARGTPSVNGEDGRIEFTIDDSGKGGDDSDSQNGAGGQDLSLFVDFRLLNTIVNVRKGYLLAKKITPTLGRSGRDVFNEEVAAEPGKWIPFNFGEGVEITDKDKNLIALRDGKVEIQDNGKLSVLDEYVIDGSIDESTGHINFWGRSLVINGSVNAGFNVDVKGDLVIEDNIDDGTKVSVGGNLEVKGIIRAENTEVEVMGDLRCSAIEYALVKVGRNLEIDDYILDAHCEVRGHVMAVRGKGLVAGGAIFIGRSLTANVLGTQAHVRTEIHAGHDPILRRKYEEALREIKISTQKLAEVENGLNKLKALEKKGPLDRKKAFIRDRLQSIPPTLKQEIDRNRSLIADMEVHLLDRMQNSTVQILQHVYPNTVIAIDNAFLELGEDSGKVRFSLKGSKIHVTYL